MKAFKRRADEKKAAKKKRGKKKRPGDEKSREGGNLKPHEIKRLRAAVAGGAEEAEAALGQKASKEKEKEVVKESAEVGYHPLPVLSSCFFGLPKLSTCHQPDPCVCRWRRCKTP